MKETLKEIMQKKFEFETENYYSKSRPLYEQSNVVWNNGFFVGIRFVDKYFKLKIDNSKSKDIFETRHRSHFYKGYATESKANMKKQRKTFENELVWGTFLNGYNDAIGFGKYFFGKYIDELINEAYHQSKNENN